MIKLKEYDLIEVDNSGWFYQIEERDSFIIDGKEALGKPTLLYDYEDCEDTYYSYIKKLSDLDERRITAVYRKKNGKLELVYSKENKYGC